MWAAFKKFIARGNVVDLAVGVIIGASFGKIVNTLVDGVLMPPLGMVLRRVDFSNMFILLDRTKGMPTSLADAKAHSIPVIAYGQLATDVISFMIVALVVFVIVQEAHKLTAHALANEPAPSTTPCPFCLTMIPIKATRCPACTSTLTPTPTPPSA